MTTAENRQTDMGGPDYWKDPKVLEKHAKRRRERYATSEEVRAEERQRQRQIYRQKAGIAFKNPARDALAAGIEERDHTSHEVSALLGRSNDYVNRLINRGLWPDPRAEAKAGNQPVFPARVVRRMLAIFADHIDNVASTYRGEHEKTKAALFAAMTEETSNG